MADNGDDAYSVFEQDHRRFGAARDEFSLTLRIKAIVGASGFAIMLCADVFYLTRS